MGNNFCVNSKGKNKEFEESRSRGQTYTKPTSKGIVTRERRCTVAEEEIVMTKLKIQIERIEGRIEELQMKESLVDQTLKTLMSQKKKEECFHCLVKKKNIRKCIKDNRNKINFLENQIMNIENSVTDLAFTNSVKESNRDRKSVV